MPNRAPPEGNDASEFDPAHPQSNPHFQIALLSKDFRYLHERVGKHREELDQELGEHAVSISELGKRVTSLEGLGFKIVAAALLGGMFTSAGIELVKFAMHK